MGTIAFYIAVALIVLVGGFVTIIHIGEIVLLFKEMRTEFLKAPAWRRAILLAMVSFFVLSWYLFLSRK